VTEHPNAVLARQLLDAFDNHDVATVINIIAEDAVWHFPGRANKIAGEHRGREAVVRFLTSVLKLTGGTFQLNVEDVLASHDGAVIIFTGSAKRNGKELSNPTALRVRVRGRQAVEFREYVWDLDHVEDFWA
jgi:ketosteroid isomerase-like protein